MSKYINRKRRVQHLPEKDFECYGALIDRKRKLKNQSYQKVNLLLSARRIEEDDW
jgi:hypothetical protein